MQGSGILAAGERFDAAVRALRGEFDPPAGVSNTERDVGLLLGSLGTTLPLVYDFKVVLKTGGADPSDLMEEMRQLVARVCHADVRPEDCRATLRKGGKYVSLSLPAQIAALEDVQRVMAALQGDLRVLMKY